MKNVDDDLKFTVLFHRWSQKVLLSKWIAVNILWRIRLQTMLVWGHIFISFVGVIFLNTVWSLLKWKHVNIVTILSCECICPMCIYVYTHVFIFLGSVTGFFSHRSGVVLWFPLRFSVFKIYLQWLNRKAIVVAHKNRKTFKKYLF